MLFDRKKDNLSFSVKKKKKYSSVGKKIFVNKNRNRFVFYSLAHQDGDSFRKISGTQISLFFPFLLKSSLKGREDESPSGLIYASEGMTEKVSGRRKKEMKENGEKKKKEKRIKR